MRSLNQILLGLLIATMITFASPRVYAGEALDAPPSAPDASAKHLFYMHGRNIERRGANSDHQYTAVREALAKKGLVVIGEVRSDTNPRAIQAKSRIR